MKPVTDPKELLEFFEYQETIQTEVMLPDDSEALLTIVYRDDALNFQLNGVTIFGGDLTSNFLPLFVRMAQMWLPHVRPMMLD